MQGSTTTTAEHGYRAGASSPQQDARILQGAERSQPAWLPLRCLRLPGEWKELSPGLPIFREDEPLPGMRAIHQLSQALPRGMGVDALGRGVHGVWCWCWRVSMGGPTVWEMWSHPWRAMADAMASATCR